MTQLCGQCLNGWRLAESCLNVVFALNEAANLLVFSGKCCAPHKFTYSVQYIILDHFGPTNPFQSVQPFELSPGIRRFQQLGSICILATEPQLNFGVPAAKC